MPAITRYLSPRLRNRERLTKTASLLARATSTQVQISQRQEEEDNNLDNNHALRARCRAPASLFSGEKKTRAPFRT